MIKYNNTELYLDVQSKSVHTRNLSGIASWLIEQLVSEDEEKQWPLLMPARAAR